VKVDERRWLYASALFDRRVPSLELTLALVEGLPFTFGLLDLARRMDADARVVGLDVLRAARRRPRVAFAGGDGLQ
jgi:hypothetical protein